MKIALIGAGAAGAACVSVLRSRGADFCVFEKSRGVGGRLATRRISGCVPTGDIFYDHGTPQFNLSAPMLNQLLVSLKPQTIESWNNDSLIACPSMPQLVKDLLNQSQVTTNFEVDAIEGKAGKWFLREKKSPETSTAKTIGPFDQVILTAPGPQARAILRETNCSWKDQIETIAYSPCWVLMVSLSKNMSVNSRTSEIFQNKIYFQQSRPRRTYLENVFSWVAHASTEWTQTHLEQTPDDIHAALMKEFLDHFSATENQILHSVVHRWRYASVTNSLGCSHLADSDLGLFYAGDGCLGRGVEGALESGLALGQELTIS